MTKVIKATLKCVQECPFWCSALLFPYSPWGIRVVSNILFTNGQKNSEQVKAEPVAGPPDQSAPRSMWLWHYSKLPQTVKEAGYSFSLSDASHFPMKPTCPGPNRSCQSQMSWEDDDFFFPFLSMSQGIQKHQQRRYDMQSPVVRASRPSWSGLLSSCVLSSTQRAAASGSHLRWVLQLEQQSLKHGFHRTLRTSRENKFAGKNANV